MKILFENKNNEHYNKVAVVVRDRVCRRRRRRWGGGGRKLGEEF